MVEVTLTQLFVVTVVDLLLCIMFYLYGFNYGKEVAINEEKERMKWFTESMEPLKEGDKKK